MKLRQEKQKQKVCRFTQWRKTFYADDFTKLETNRYKCRGGIMTENEEFTMSDKQTYDMIEKLSDKLETKTEAITENLNLLRQEVRQYNHVKDEVEKIHLKIDEHTDQINCNTKTLSNINQADKAKKETNRDWGYWLPWVIAIILSTSKIIELWKG